MSEPPQPLRSLRWPWIRAGFAGLITTLLPLVWLTRMSACNSHTTLGDRTGLDLASERMTDVESVIVWALLLSATLAAPFLAARVTRAAGRAALHVGGLLATIGAFGGPVAPILLPLFETVRARPAGYAVVALAIGAGVEALARVVLALSEWRAERRTPV